MMQERPGNGGCHSWGILWFGKSATILFGQPFLRGEALLAIGQLPAALRHWHRLRGNRVHLAFLLDDFADGLLLQRDGNITVQLVPKADTEDASRVADVIVRIDIDVVPNRGSNPARMIEHVWHRLDDLELPLCVATSIECDVPDGESPLEAGVVEAPWADVRLDARQVLEILRLESDIDRLHALMEIALVNQAEHPLGKLFLIARRRRIQDGDGLCLRVSCHMSSLHEDGATTSLR